MWLANDEHEPQNCKTRLRGISGTKAIYELTLEHLLTPVSAARRRLDGSRMWIKDKLQQRRGPGLPENLETDPDADTDAFEWNNN